MHNLTTLKHTFTDIYNRKGWGDGESVSGPGSSVAVTKDMVMAIEEWLQLHHIKSIVDAPCGDFNWFSKVRLGQCSYIGVDIVDELVRSNNQKYNMHRFITRDITCDELPSADCLLCRDCLIHLGLASIGKAIANFRRSGYQYLLSTTFPISGSIADINDGGWRKIDLEKLLGPCIEYLPDTVEHIEHSDKRLGVWQL